MWLPALRRPRLLSAPSPRYAARLLRVDGTAYLIPVDANWPVAPLGDLEGLVAFDEPDEDEGDEDERGTEDEDEELPETPEALRAWLAADDLREEEEEREIDKAFGPEAERPVPVTVFGAPRPGASIALAKDGDTWLTEVVPADFEFRLRATIRRATTDEAPHSLLGSLINAHPRVVQGLWATVCVLGAAVVSWLIRFDTGDGWLEILIFTAVWVAAVFGSGLGDGAVTLTREHVILHGLVLDNAISASQVVFAVAVDEGLALRLRDPDDVVVLAPRALTRHASSTPDEGLATLEVWRQHAQQDSPGGRRPSVLLVGAAAVVAVGVGNVLLLVM